LGENKLPGVYEHVQHEAPELALFVRSVDEQTDERLRLGTTLSADVVRCVANQHRLMEEQRHLYGT